MLDQCENTHPGLNQDRVDVYFFKKKLKEFECDFHDCGESFKRVALMYQPTDSQQRRFPDLNVRRASHASTSGRGLGSDCESGVRLEADWKPSSSD